MKKHLLVVGGDITLGDSDICMNDVKVDNTILTSSLDLNKKLIYFNKFPDKNSVSRCRFPIVIYFDKLDRYKIPQYIKQSFTIKYNEQEMNIFRVLSAVFYNPNRDAVYDILRSTNIPPILLYKWIECNAYRVWVYIPDEVCRIDTMIHKIKQDILYKYIAYSLPIADRRVQFRWIK